jgi:hypothetical protein
MLMKMQSGGIGSITQCRAVQGSAGQGSAGQCSAVQGSTGQGSMEEAIPCVQLLLLPAACCLLTAACSVSSASCSSVCAGMQQQPAVQCSALYCTAVAGGARWVLDGAPRGGLCIRTHCILTHCIGTLCIRNHCIPEHH